MSTTTFIQPNRLAARLVTKRLAAWGACALSLAAGLFASSSAAPVWLALAGIAALAASRTGRLEGAGADGEAVTLAMLRQLPTNCVVFNQLRIPCARSSTGWLEADFVVLTPRRLALIETKHNKDRMQAQVAPGRWKTDTGTMRSPVRQATRQAVALRTWLAAQGVPAWVEAAVHFTHPQASVAVRDWSDVSLVARNRLLEWFAWNQPSDGRIDYSATLAALQRLRASSGTP